MICKRMFLFLGFVYLAYAEMRADYSSLGSFDHVEGLIKKLHFYSKKSQNMIKYDVEMVANGKIMCMH